MTDITYATLASINVNDHTEKKGTLTYLSWAWAVDQLLRHDPDASWDYRCWSDQPVCILHDGTAMVCCTVTVGGRSKTAWLPVMDNKNRAIVGPDAFAINSAMQRALVKAIALCGLGLYIYAGEDLPMEDDAAAAAAQDAYAAWLETLKPIADTGDFQALVAAIKLQPAYATLLRSKDMATWAALKARQEAAKAPAEALVDTMEAAGIPISKITVDGVVTAGGAIGAGGGNTTSLRAFSDPALNAFSEAGMAAAKADADYKAGIKKVKDVMKRAGGSLREFPSA